MFASRFTSWALLTTSLLLLAQAAAAQVTVIPLPEEKKVFEVVGQFNNTATTSVQFGYLSNLRGLSPIFSGPTQDESTALFTFVTNATTDRVIGDGPLKIINRSGSTTIYLNTPPSDFTDASTFAQGTPIQVSSYQQQVILNTLTGSFTTVHFNLITSAPVFSFNGKLYRLGTVGGSFRTFYNGQANAGTPPPSGWFAGFALGLKR